MSETDLRFIALPGDFKTDFRVLPFALVLSEIEIVFQNTPDDFLARDALNQLHLATMDVLLAVRELIAGFVGAAFNVF